VGKRKGAAGFTLLELVVSFTILGLIVIVVFGALRLGTNAWERGGDQSELVQRRRVVLNLLSQQIKSAFPYKVKASKAEPDYIAFQGTPDSMQFVSAFSLKARRSEGLVVVYYRVEDGKGSEKVLKYFEKRALNKDFFEKMPDSDEYQTLLDDLSGLSFEYFKAGDDDDSAGEWVTSYDGKDETELPRQMKIAASWKEKRGDAEVTLPATVSIPAYLYDDRGKTAKPRPRPPRSTH
jgi:general secretion pathway protein J